MKSRLSTHFKMQHGMRAAQSSRDRCRLQVLQGHDGGFAVYNGEAKNVCLKPTCGGASNSSKIRAPFLK